MARRRAPTKVDTAAGSDVLATAAGEAPSAPGVYLFLGQAQEVLYVGKATRLSARLGQHARVRAPTSHLHERYARVRRVVWEVTEDERSAAWNEADLIYALQPPFNANPGLRAKQPAGFGRARSPYLVLSEGAGDQVRFTLESEPAARSRVYGCFPHLGKGVSSSLGIAGSDGLVALLRLLWAASGDGTHVPAAITRSAPTRFETSLAAELRPGLHRMLSGVSDRIVPVLLDAATSRPAFMHPALRRDASAAKGFFAAGPRRLRIRRLRHGISDRVLDDEAHRSLIVRELVASVGDVTLSSRPSFRRPG